MVVSASYHPHHLLPAEDALASAAATAALARFASEMPSAAAFPPPAAAAGTAAEAKGPTTLGEVGRCGCVDSAGGCCPSTAPDEIAGGCLGDTGLPPGVGCSCCGITAVPWTPLPPGSAARCAP